MVRDMEESHKKAIGGYIRLLRGFVMGKITAPEFESQYMLMYKNDIAFYPEPIHVVLAKLSSDVDAYCSIPEIRDENDLDDAQLFEQAKDALNILENLIPESF